MVEALETTAKRPRRAIALISGGLDSALAAKIVKNEGVEVIGLHLLSPFGCREEVEKVCEGIGIPLITKEKGAAYLDLVENPRYGYGRNMNPCVDCRIFMFQLADVVRQDKQADFIITGEVLGQRPMSQQRNAMNTIDNQSAMGDRVLRPLSAHHFEPTLPEREGWIRREALFNISGRGRKDQIALAKELGIEFYTSPAGGCLLTDANFSKRLRDFFDNKTHTSDEERLAQAEMLRLGRHFRFHEDSKSIVARNHKENLELRRLWPKSKGTLVVPDNFEGPIAIHFGEGASSREEGLELTAQLIARYGRSEGLNHFKFSIEKQETLPGEVSFSQRKDPTLLEKYLI